MLPHSGLSASVPDQEHATADPVSTTRLSIDVRRFPWIRRLVADYAFEYGSVAEFFAGNPEDPAAWSDSVARTRRYSRQRGPVADLLQAQQRRRGAPAEALAASELIRDSHTVAVVTGQQAGLFGGPLFTLLKALTAIRLAEQLRAEQGVTAVAIFWIDAEDHDWDEVKSCGTFDADLNLRTVSVGNPPGAHEGPVARVRLDASIEDALGGIEALLPRTEFSDTLFESLRRAYGEGVGMADAFGRWLEAVLGHRGLIVYDSSDVAAKSLVAGVFAREIETAGETSRLAAEAGTELQARGYHAQATPQHGSVALFQLNGGREAIRVQDGVFTVGDRAETKESLLAQVRQSPADFSPNVLLRPLVQDTLFPTVCYVAGPSELAYLAQLRGVYASFGIPMPLIHHRATATILDSNSMRFVVRNDFPLELLRAQDEAALNDLLASQLPPTVEGSLHDALRAVEERMAVLSREVSQIDPTLEGAARSTLVRMEDDLKKLHAKIIQAAKRKHETLRRQFRHAQAQAFPGGHPQERTIGMIYFLNKYGPMLVNRLDAELPLMMGMHWVVTI